MDYQNPGPLSAMPSLPKPSAVSKIILVLILLAAVAGAVWFVTDYGWFGYLSRKDRSAIIALISNYYADYAGRVDTNDAWQAFADRYVSGTAKEALLTEANSLLSDTAKAQQHYFDAIDILKTKIMDSQMDKAVVFSAERVKSRILGLPPETKIVRTVFYLRKSGGQWLIAGSEPYASDLKMTVDYFSHFDGVAASTALSENALMFGSEEPADVYEAGAIIMRLTGDQSLIDQSLADDYRKNVENFFVSKKIDLVGQVVTPDLLSKISAAAGVRISSNIAVDSRRVNMEINRGELTFFALATAEGAKRPNPAPLRNIACGSALPRAFPVRAEDAQAWAEVDYPNGGESFSPGDTMTVNWRSSGTKPASSEKSIRISLLKGGEEVSSFVTENDGTEAVALKPERAIGSDYKVAVSYTYDYPGCCDDACLSDCRFQGIVTDESDHDFCLASSSAPATP